MSITREISKERSTKRKLDIDIAITQRKRELVCREGTDKNEEKLNTMNGNFRCQFFTKQIHRTY